MSIHKLPATERPRERLQQLGPETLSVVELLAIILCSGRKGVSAIQLAHDLLARFGSLDEIALATIPELCALPGIGPAKAIQLKAALHLSSRLQGPQINSSPPIHHPKDLFQSLHARLQTETREILLLFMLNARGSPFREEIISIGSLTQTIVHPREIFHPAIRHKAASILLAHNHPSGNPTPSQQDLTITKQLLQASHLIGIPLHDHLIIGHHSYTSLRSTTNLWN